MGMELLIGIIAVAVIAILWALRNDMKADATNEAVADEPKTETVTVTVTEKTEVVVEDKEPAKAVKKSTTKKAPAVKKAPAKKVAAPKTKAAAPKKKVAPAKKKAAPKK